MELLAGGLSGPEAIRRLAGRFGISERQARRYVERAGEWGRVEIPEPTQVFTVKLPQALVRRIKQHANRQRQTLSSLVAQAIEEFLHRARRGSRSGRSPS